MCNDYEQNVKWQLYKDALAKLGLNMPDNHGPDDLRQADDVRIGDRGPVVRTAGNGIELTQMTFGFPSPKPNRPRVFNFKSENRDFSDSKRCGILASAFFEFTGNKYPKAKHRFTLKDAPFFFVAGLWREAGDQEGESFTMLTTSPGPDVAPFHDRQIVVLSPEHLANWLYLDKPHAELLRPLAVGSLNVETVRPGSD